MAKAGDHIPKDLGKAVIFCAVNSAKYPYLTRQAQRKLQKASHDQLKQILNKDYDGCSLLYCAAEHGNARICQTLLGYGAQPNRIDKAGNTPLHQASRYERLECIEILWQHGADVQAKNDAGQTPRRLAEDHGMIKAVKKLVAMAERAHVIGPMIQENFKEITANKDAIQENLSTGKKNQTVIAELTSKVDQLTGEMAALKETVEAQHEELATLKETLETQHQDHADALHEQHEQLDKVQQKLQKLESATNIRGHGTRLAQLEKAVFQEDIPVSTSKEELRHEKLQQNYIILSEEVDSIKMRAALFAKKVLSIHELQVMISSGGDERQQREWLLVTLFSKDMHCWVTPFLDALKDIDINLYNAITSTAEDETDVKAAF